ncbi:MAG: type II toxin-antitoxin system VapC family toxin [Ignavibacteriae bacterium]|nr:type II toxin-antitoxin system VapC family toxin [Ignavibacteriota bacterium]
MFAKQVFLDASYAIALSSSNDSFHEKAETIALQLEKNNTRIVTTRAVVVEIGNALAKLRFRNEAIRLLLSLETDPTITIVPLSEELFRRAFEFYRQRKDKEWGITDCVSFVAMKDSRLTDALTADEHFQQAGFRALLLLSE